MENKATLSFCGGLRFLMIQRVRSKLVCSGLARICSSFCVCVCVSNWKPNSSVVLGVGMWWGEWKRFNTHTHKHQLHPISLFLLKAYLLPHPTPLTSYHILLSYVPLPFPSTILYLLLFSLPAYSFLSCIRDEYVMTEKAFLSVYIVLQISVL